MKLSRAEFGRRWAAEELVVSLVGMSNVGKSWLAARLSKHLGAQALEVDTFIRRQLGQRSMADLAHWLGHPDTVGYAAREQQSLQLEERATLAALRSVEAPALLDTTGSVIYCPRSCERLRAETFVVYLRASGDTLKTLENLYFTHPKPLNWAGRFTMRDGEMFGDAVRRCYPKLLQSRDALYHALADHVVDAADIYAASGGDALWHLLHPAGE